MIKVSELLELLNSGGLLAIPLKFGWFIGGLSSNKLYATKLQNLPKELTKNQLLALVSNENMLEHHVHQFPDAAYDLLELNTKPLILILDNPKDFGENVKPNTHLGFYMVEEQIAKNILLRTRKPLLGYLIDDSAYEVLRNLPDVVHLPIQKEAFVDYSVMQLHEDGVIKIIKA